MIKMIVLAGLVVLTSSAPRALAQPAPAITQNPASQSVVVGSNAIFTATASGQSPDYHWFCNGTNLLNSGRINGANSSTLTIADVTGADAGDYFLVASNRHGTASSSVATLTVLFPPEITVPPSAQAIVVNSNVSFSVTATGSSPLFYHWSKNGSGLSDGPRISGSSTATLTVTDVETNDAGEYSVTVWNVAGTTSSAEVTLSVLVPPTITQQPLAQSQVIGSNVVFSVTATGDDPLSYSWSFNGTNLVDGPRITGALTSTLSISNLQSSDEGMYSVTVSNSAGTANSEAVSLTALFPPAFVQHPVSQIATNGLLLTLSATASGTAPISYQWFFHETTLNNNDRISGADTLVLSISNLQTNDAGDYRLVASNAYGQATSEVANITVVVPPRILENPTNRTVVGTNGSSTVFTVLAEGSEPMSYQWYLGTNALVDTTKRLGCTTPSLTITNISSFDEGSYNVVVSNPYGSATGSPAVLTVLVPPAVNLQPISQSTPPGLPVTLTANAQGTQPLRFQWWFNGSILPGATNTSLALAALATNNVGNYHVVITNAVGSATSAVAQVTFGSVAAWGRNNSLECTPPPGLSNIFAVAGIYGASMAVRTDGNLVTWGSTKTTGDSIVGIAASSGIVTLRPDGTVAGGPPTTNVVAIAIGQNHGLALRREGTVTMWGSQFPNTPIGLNNVAAVAAGPFLSLALKSNGTVVAWGINAGTNVPAGLKDVTAIAGGPSHGLALKSNGTVVAWGTGPAATVPPGLSNVVAISAANYSQTPSHNLALRSDGTVVAWGSVNSFGETNVPPALSNVIAIASAPLHSLAIVGDGRPVFLRPPVGGRAFFRGDFALHGEATGQKPMSYQWSVNGTNIVGATNSSLVLTNVQFSQTGNYSLYVSNALGTLTSIPALVNVSHQYPQFLSFETNKTVYRGGKLVIDPTIIGSGPLTYQWIFKNTNLPGATNRVLSIAHADFANAGVYNLVVSNYMGSVISPTVTVKVLGPVVSWAVSPTAGAPVVPANLTNAIAISAANNHALALRDDGMVVGFGSNFYGQTNVPPGLSNVVEIAAGGNQSLALRTDGTVVGWGSMQTNSLLTLSNIISIEADSFGWTALHANGTITRNGSTPQNHIATNVIALAPFDDGFFSIRANGTFGTTGSGFAPPPTNNVMAIGASRYHGSLLRRDGSVLGWGTPVISNPPSRVISVASTSSGKWAVDGDGAVMLLGTTGTGESGKIPTGLESVSVIDAGYNYVLALTTARDLNSITLSDATDTAELVISSKNSPQWFAQTTVTHDGTDAARSAAIGRNTASSMRMFAAGPATVRFWWKVSSQTNSDHLSFSISGTTHASISGESGWEQRTINIPGGRHILVWKYSKDSNGTAGQDAGWVDQIEILPPAPYIVRQPFDKNVLSGSPLQIPVAAGGATPLFYRWFKNGQAIPNATNSLFNIPVATRSDSGTYHVTVTNIVGSVTSSNAIVKVIAPQVFDSPTFSNGVFVLNSSDSDGGLLSESDLPSFQAQASTNLVDWEILTNALSITNGVLRLSDPQSTNAPNRYYRIVENW